LSPEERQQLEANLKADGCRDPLVVWNGTLLDGHNRYAICKRHHLPFKTVERKCADRDAAKVWIIQSQFGRRNLRTYARAKLALALEPLIRQQAAANQKAGRDSRWDKSASARVEKPIDTWREMAKATRVAPATIAKVKVIEAHAPEPVKAALRAGTTTINREYTKAPVARGFYANVALISTCAVLNIALPVISIRSCGK